MNAKLLRSIMILHDDTGEKLAGVIGITPQRFSAKLNEYEGAEFTQSEIRDIRNRYKLTDEQVVQIFFANSVSSKDTEVAQ